MGIFEQIFEMNKKLDKMYRMEFNKTLEETRNDDILLLIMEVGEIANATKCCKYWSKRLPESRAKILEEYTDGLYVLFNFCHYTGITMNNELVSVPKLELTEMLIEVSILITNLYNNFNKENVQKLFAYYIELAKLLGLDLNEVKADYIAKYQVIVDSFEEKKYA